MEKWVTPPGDFYEWLLGYPWPISWAYFLLAIVVLVGLFCFRPVPRGVPVWLLLLPVAWFAWTLLSGIQSLEPRLTGATLKHFASCLVCFYLGYFALSHARALFPFWLGLFSGFLGVLAVGMEQHFGGLEESRRYFFLYVYPHMMDPPAEYIKKMSSSRIFSTLFYPNALAGSLLLLLPALFAVFAFTKRMTVPARAFLIAVIGLAALACLYWSGSKGGWLLMLLLGLVALVHLQLGNHYKIVIITVVLAIGLSGFFWKYSGFFKKGATSVSARFDYWQAALQTVREHPLLGTGPGTFAIPYQRLKRPESEMSRMVHNDYLEQASDSGVVACITYTVFIVGVLVWSYPGLPRRRLDEIQLKSTRKADPPQGAGEDRPWISFCVWLGVLGWSLQGLFEFGLYIPGLAWIAMVFMGWLLAQAPQRLQLSEALEREIASTKHTKKP